MNKATKQISKLFAAMAMAGVASYSVAADTIKIALAGPVTGAVAQYGEMQFIGAKMAIEQINKAGGVNGAMLEGVVGASHTGFQVSQQGVDPVQWLCLDCFSPTSCDIALMRGLRRFDLSKSMGAITDHMAAGGEIALCPLLHGFLCEILDGREPHVQRPPLICRLYSRDKGCLVGCFAATIVVACSLASQISIIDFHPPLQRIACITLVHGLHQLVLEQPGAAVANAQLAFE